MNFNKYKNQDGEVIFAGLNEQVYGTLTVENENTPIYNDYLMELPNDNWKRVTKDDLGRITQYSDSEGNVWNRKMKDAFPYVYESLERETLKVVLAILKKDLEVIQTVSKEVRDTLKLSLSVMSQRDALVNPLRAPEKEISYMVDQMEELLYPSTKSMDMGNGDCEAVQEAPRSLTQMLR